MQSAENLYSRARGDPAFLQAVRSAYTGRHDALDALWWEAHPMDAAPSGTPSPADSLSQLKHRLFAADGESLGDRAATQELRDLEAQISADQLAIKHAIAVATREAPAPGPDKAASKPLGRPPVNLHGGDDTPPRPTLTRRARYSLVAAVVLAALACGLFIGTQIRGSSEPDPQLVAALSVFEREQAMEDIPIQSMPATLQPESFRELLPARFSWTRHSVYVATSMRDAVCLIALTSEEEHVSTCTGKDEFPVDGLQLSWSTSVESQRLDSQGTFEPAQMYVIWMPDGSVVSTGSPL